MVYCSTIGQFIYLYEKAITKVIYEMVLRKTNHPTVFKTAYLHFFTQVIPAKGHANVSVCFTPHPTEEVSHDMSCDGFILGYMSLDNSKGQGEEGKVSRSQDYMTSQLKLDMTAHLKPAL